MAPPTVTGKELACGDGNGYKTSTDHPINFAIGNKYFHATDYRGIGSFPIVFDRSYNSYVLGWRYAYTQRIEHLAVDKVSVRRPNGKSYEFNLTSGQWLSDPDVLRDPLIFLDRCISKFDHATT